jgi:hypothetical protein
MKLIQKHKKSIIIFFTVILGVFMFVSISFYFALRNLVPLCSDEIVAEGISPNGNHKAVIFVRNCGATTDFSSQVAIMDNKEKFNSKINAILIADTDHGESPAWQWGGPEIKTQWEDDNNMTIFLHSQARVFKKANIYRGINIVYEYF